MLLQVRGAVKYCIKGWVRVRSAAKYYITGAVVVAGCVFNKKLGAEGCAFKSCFS